jgi:hypothetical protein
LGRVHQEPGRTQRHQPPDVVGLGKLAGLRDGKQQLVLRAEGLAHSRDHLGEERVGNIRRHHDHDGAHALGERTADPVHHVAKLGDGLAHFGNVLLRDAASGLAVGNQRDGRGGDAGAGGNHRRRDTPRTRGLLKLFRGVHTSIVVGEARGSAHEVEVGGAGRLLLGRPAPATALGGGTGEDHQQDPNHLDGRGLLVQDE